MLAATLHVPDVNAINAVAAAPATSSAEARVDPPALSDRAESLKTLRGLVGPHASSAQLKNQLQRFSNDPRKAANGYFRSACVCDLPFDFQPRPLSRSAAGLSGIKGPSLPWLDLDMDLFPAASFLEIDDCWALLTASREIHQRVIHQEAFWAAAFQTVFLEVPCLDVASQAPGHSAELGYAGSASFRRFRERWRQELSRSCPKCGAREAIVPVVYGFPSATLTAHFRRKTLMLTEVCGFLGPCWVCRRCTFEFEQYPYLGDLQPVKKAERKYPFLRVCLAADGALDETDREDSD